MGLQGGSLFCSPSCANYRYIPISAREEDSSPCNRLHNKKQSWRSIVLVSNVSAVVLLLGLVSRGASRISGSLNLASVKIFGDVKDGTAAMSVRVQHSYGSEDNMQMYPWEYTAEPYRKSVMQVMGWSNDLVEDAVIFRWIIDGVEVGNGTSLVYYFEALGQHECSVVAVRALPRAGRSEEGERVLRRADEAVIAEYHFTVMVKYVRREIRSMTDRDREIFFNAVSVLQRVPSVVGQKVYGEKYYSKDFFNRLHLYYGGRRDCDHWHSGAGFVTSHVAMSLMFEQALQAVNPSIALPYWDFTIEETEYDWINFRRSSVFSDDWFGSTTPRNEFRTTDRGRFAYVPTMIDAREYSALYNAYGLLRSPWNTDPNPFLSRHDHIFGFPNNRKPSGCKEYRGAVLQKTWMDLTESMNADAHGHIHEILGGTWSADWRGFDEKTSERIFPFVHNILPYMKFIWRSGHLECPESCTKDIPWRDCQCTCADIEANSKTPPQILKEAGLLTEDAALFFYDKDMNLIDRLGDHQGDALIIIPGYSEEETKEIYREVLSVLCTPMKIGSHYEGTSANDVTFWVLHPTFDRLWHLQRLEGDTAFDDSWVTDNKCYGHNPSDIQPFFNLFGDRSTEGMPKMYYTNEELYDLLRPDGTPIPYMYDNFEWPHCSNWTTTSLLAVSSSGSPPSPPVSSRPQSFLSAAQTPLGSTVPSSSSFLPVTSRPPSPALGAGTMSPDPSSTLVTLRRTGMPSTGVPPSPGGFGVIPAATPPPRLPFPHRPLYSPTITFEIQNESAE